MKKLLHTSGQLLFLLILPIACKPQDGYAQDRDGADIVSLHPNHQPTYKDHLSGEEYGGQASGTYVKKHKDVYKPHPEKCHPQTITKYKTVYKDRKAVVKNQVEILNPQPHVKKITETRYTTIRYPVFITQVIKPVITQVETKVKPIFKTKTINKYTTVLFTVTGIGQATVTRIKYEKEYITRCMKKKGYGHGGGHKHENSYHRSDDVPVYLEVTNVPKSYDKTISIAPPPGLPYEYADSTSPLPSRLPQNNLSKRTGTGPFFEFIQPRVPFSSEQLQGLETPEKNSETEVLQVVGENPNRMGEVLKENILEYEGQIGDVMDLYSDSVYYKSRPSTTSGEREAKALEPTQTVNYVVVPSAAHPPLEDVPLSIIVDEGLAAIENMV